MKSRRGAAPLDDESPPTLLRAAVAVVSLALVGSGCGGLGTDAGSDVSVENVSVQMPERDGQPASIVFDVAWPVSFRDDLNADAVWVFVKFRESGQVWRHARLSTDRTAHRVGNNNGVLANLVPSGDGLGVFLQRAEDGVSSIDWDQVALSWDLGVDGVAKEATVLLEVIALQMVHVPSGPYLLGDGTAVDALMASQFEAGTSGNPYEITGEDEITLGGGGANSLGNNDRRSAAGTPLQFLDDFSDSVSRVLPTAFPKGFDAFYVMKNELTQGDYARFLNTLDPAQQAVRNPFAEIPTGEGHRYAISAQAPFEADPYNRAAHWLSWMDLAAYADWSGLRPMTELEFEKASRGDRLPDPGEFAWGPEAPPAGKYTLQDPDTAAELVVNQHEGANVAFDGTVGLAGSIAGPLRVGAFIPLAASRVAFGGSQLRVTELSGNVAEMVVSIGRSAGRRFQGGHGDGMISGSGNAAGAEVEMWPGARRVARGGFEVMNADGSGIRGGDWSRDALRLRVSDREDANRPADRRDMRWGGRLVRSVR